MKQVRLSNFELCRLLCMILVVAGHANYISLGFIDGDTFQCNPLDSTLRIFLYQLSVVAVDVFVLISGWFGISNMRSLKRVLTLTWIYGFVLFFCEYLLIGGGWNLTPYVL